VAGPWGWNRRGCGESRVQSGRVGGGSSLCGKWWRLRSKVMRVNLAILKGFTNFGLAESGGQPPCGGGGTRSADGVSRHGRSTSTCKIGGIGRLIARENLWSGLTPGEEALRGTCSRARMGKKTAICCHRLSSKEQRRC